MRIPLVKANLQSLDSLTPSGELSEYKKTPPKRSFSLCPEQELNQRHKDFQSFALPTELSGQIFQRWKTVYIKLFSATTPWLAKEGTDFQT